MNDPFNIVIVGGGTAGWMTAAALAAMVPETMARVRLVESDEIGTVGVGEATLPQMKDFNDMIGVIESDMMQQTNATFKLGIEFVDWGYQGSSYIHPFGVHGDSIGGVAFHHQWLRALLAGEDGIGNIEDFSYAIRAARSAKFDFPSTEPGEINSTYSYAYHFDASLYAAFLRKFAERRGVQRTEGKVVDVSLNGNTGNIETIALESGDVIAGDLFIDCSGFRALLIGKALENDYEPWTDWLPCDRAVAVPCQRADTDLLPYTRATARQAGWTWRIPLQHRTGNGYVYSSQFVSDDEAASTLLAALDGEPTADPRFLNFTAGRRKVSWDRNCVAIGLSSGFLEPLESTSIYLIQAAIINLLKNFPRNHIEPAQVAEFNRLVDLEYERVRDFLILHYYANTRDDAELWRYCRSMQIPDSLEQKLSLFRQRGHIDIYHHGLFSPASWLSVYLGQGVRPTGYDPMAENMPLERTVAEIRSTGQRIADRVTIMPGHDDFIRDYCPATAPEKVMARLGAAQ